MSKAKKEVPTETSKEVVLTKKDVKEVAVLDFKTICKEQMDKYLEKNFDVNFDNKDEVTNVTITFISNMFLKNLTCCKLSVSAGLVSSVIISREKPSEFESEVDYVIKKPADLNDAIKDIYTRMANRLIEISEDKRKLHIKTEVAKLHERIKKNPNDFIDNLDEDVYHSGPGVSTSMLNELQKSCKNLDFRLENPKKKTKDMELGSALHDFVLRPDLFWSLNYVAPDLPKNTIEGKIAHLTSALMNHGKRDLSNEDVEMLKKAKDELYKHPVSSALLKEGFSELSFYCNIKVNEENPPVVLRGRADGLIQQPSKELVEVLSEDFEIPEDAIIIYDLKFLRDNGDENEQLGRTFMSSGYHRQAFNYSDCVERLTGRPVVFIFLTITKDGTFDVVPAQLGEKELDLGKYEIEKLREKYVSKFLSKTAYRGRSKGVMMINFPMFAFSKMELDIE